MPRKNLIRSDVLPYHVSARANNREHFPLDIGEVWRIITNEGYLVSSVYGAEIQSFVLMPNHFHMMLTVPEFDLGKVMNVFMSDITRTMNLVAGRSGRIFGGPYHQSLIQSATYYAHALKYVYRNPVKAGLVERVEDYRWSTVHGSFGRSHLPFPLYFPRAGIDLSFVPQEMDLLLAWLNRPTPKEIDELITKGLKKKVFGALKNRNTRSPEEMLERYFDAPALPKGGDDLFSRPGRRTEGAGGGS